MTIKNFITGLLLMLFVFLTITTQAQYKVNIAPSNIKKKAVVVKKIDTIAIKDTVVKIDYKPFVINDTLNYLFNNYNTTLKSIKLFKESNILGQKQILGGFCTSFLGTALLTKSYQSNNKGMKNFSYLLLGTGGLINISGWVNIVKSYRHL